jgi:hypothetical protein
MYRRWLLLPVLSLFLVGLTAGPALAQETCYDYCLKSGNPGDCSSRCAPGGDLELTHPWAPGRFWGAIAYSAKDKGSGWSHGLADLNEAKRVALENCSGKGSECKLWVWYSDACGAIAVDGKIVTWGTASAKNAASQRAVTECVKAGGKDCRVEVSRCSH